MKSDYTRLPGAAHSFLGFGRSRLWLGNDHILLIQRRGYVEDYKRFYFRDIRSIVIQKTFTSVVINCAAGFLLATSVLFHSLGVIHWGWDPIGHVFMGIPTIGFFLILLANLIMGATCLTKLVTAVHSVSIPSMNRLRSSLRVVNILRQKIEAVQGHLPPEVLLQHPGIEEPPVLFPPPVKTTVKSGAVNDGGGMHLALFVLLLFDAAMTVLSIFNRSQILLAVSLISSVLLWGLLILALIRQRRRMLPAGVTGLTWGVLIYSVIYYTWGYLFTIYFAIQHPGTTSRWEWIKMVWDLSPLENPGIFVMTVFSIACSLSLGIPGLISILRFRARSKGQSKIQIAGGEAA